MDDIFHAMPDDLTNRKHHDGAKNSDANSKPLSNVPEVGIEVEFDSPGL